jgi:hypothetical protein
MLACLPDRWHTLARGEHATSDLSFDIGGQFLVEFQTLSLLAISNHAHDTARLPGRHRDQRK